MDHEKVTGTGVTVRQLAEMFGVTTRTIYSWRSREDWPFGKPPYNVADVSRWRVGHLSRAPDHRTPAERRRARDATTRLTLARINRLELEIQLLHEKYVLKSDADAIIGEIIAFMLEPLERMIADLPPRLVGLDAPAIERVFDDRVGKMRHDWSAEIQEIIDQKGEDK